mmetsp:Transcript_1277/g.2778  ORF Transcript_1277/g.2778 Transcript_1277/m.2778 type:complete len:100 (-) Transcript_1277:457-756(-)|eukprot:CAMPEP_0172528804 /NCGR_PEP_ID=MMETSP1067-20121228/3061_1 /TAXON_ID=265564 ORGANISM="Thalassiosira punctigera, Strain Tpunct2005C2" /NCGR_SAMPLE_ID=MMETSP1067 /ASSEMBLY_ACC=CAM_ASM_000444 /LENGTH=99 /DNA_ID=CAMNT_0013312769 /DNA_START=283 /DNA_END=582 /DNA_ORIENTATION=-
MSFATRAADLAHKTVVSSFIGLFCYQAYQLQYQMRIGTDEAKKREHPQAGFIQMLRDKYDEEYKKYYDTGHRDWYDKDDDSYLKNLPRPQDYQPGGKRN